MLVYKLCILYRALLTELWYSGSTKTKKGQLICSIYVNSIDEYYLFTLIWHKQLRVGWAFWPEGSWIVKKCKQNRHRTQQKWRFFECYLSRSFSFCISEEASLIKQQFNVGVHNIQLGSKWVEKLGGREYVTSGKTYKIIYCFMEIIARIARYIHRTLRCNTEDW